MGLVGEAGAVESGEEEIAGAVAGEAAAGAVGAVGGGGEADDPDAGGGVAEAGDGLGEVGPVSEGGAFGFGDFFAVGDEARAAVAGGDVGGEGGGGVGGRSIFTRI